MCVKSPPGVIVSTVKSPSGALPYPIPPDHRGLQVAASVLRDFYGKEPYRIRMGGTLPPKPSVLLLDEPLAGLGGLEIKGVLGGVGKHLGRQTILIVEHKISKVEDFSERLTVLYEARIMAEQTLARERALIQFTPSLDRRAWSSCDSIVEATFSCKAFPGVRANMHPPPPEPVSLAPSAPAPRHRSIK